MEKWDAYDEDLNKIPDVTLIRGEKIPDGIFHLVSDILVRHADGSYLLMQRDRRKHFGGMWEATAGGSALAGESPIECAARELWEETGIKAENLLEVSRTKNGSTIYVEHLCITDCPKDSVRLQDGETIACKWVSRLELLEMTKDKLVTERMQKFISELQQDSEK